MRACRLVVDTVLHSLKWSRAQAIDYLIVHAHVDPGFAEAEVARYLVWPGQADSYEVGEHEILALRDRARDTKLHSCGIDGPSAGAAVAVEADVMFDRRCSLRVVRIRSRRSMLTGNADIYGRRRIW